MKSWLIYTVAIAIACLAVTLTTESPVFSGFLFGSALMVARWSGEAA